MNIRLHKPLVALMLSAFLGATAVAQFPVGTASAAHDLDDAAVALLLHIQQNHASLTTLSSVASTLETEADLFHDFIEDVENQQNNRTVGETPCEFHRVLRAFFATVDEVTLNWPTLSTDTTFLGLWNTTLSDGAALTSVLLTANPRLIYLYLKSTESLSHKMEDEAAAILLHLQQNHPTETNAIALAQTFFNTADAYHTYAHDVGKCMKPFTGLKAEYLKLQFDMFTLGIELVNKGLIPKDAVLFGMALNLVNYYTQHTNGLAVGGLL